MAEPNRNLQPLQFYHASPHPFNVGDAVEPGHEPAYSHAKQEHVFITASKRNAMAWARTSSGPASVYSVSTPREYEPDPLPTGPREYRTRESVTVTGVLKRYPGNTDS